MIQLRSVLKPADNSGAKRLMVINIPGYSKKYWATVGQVVTCVVDQADPGGVVKNSEVVKALIIRTKKEFGRSNGVHVRFDDNAAVIINKDGNLRGTRIFGPVAREVKEKGFAKVASLAKELI